MTDWTPRDIDLDLAFLGPGHFQAKIYADGPNANQNAKDLTVSESTIEATDDVTIHLASGGGWAAVVTPISAGP